MPDHRRALGTTLRTTGPRALENPRGALEDPVDDLCTTGPRPADDGALIPTPRPGRWQPCGPLGITDGQQNTF